jgi:hypothetical protein
VAFFQRRIWIVAILVAVAFIGLALALGVRDPTESTFAVRIVNDRPVSVELRQCRDTHCGGIAETDSLAQGESVEVNTSASDAPNWWIVENDTGQRLGCLNLQYDRKINNLSLGLAQLVPCPADNG